MQPDRASLPIRRSARRLLGPCAAAVQPFARLQAHSCPGSHQRSPRHPQIGQRKQRVQLRGVLDQSTVAHVHMPEPGFEDSGRMLDLGPDAGFQAFELLGQFVDQSALVQFAALARAHDDVPAHASLDVGALVHPLAAGVCPDMGFLAVQQAHRATLLPSPDRSA